MVSSLYYIETQYMCFHVYFQLMAEHIERILLSHFDEKEGVDISQHVLVLPVKI
jgi:hypothetical protein